MDSHAAYLFLMRRDVVASLIICLRMVLYNLKERELPVKRQVLIK